MGQDSSTVFLCQKFDQEMYSGDLNYGSFEDQKHMNSQHLNTKHFEVWISKLSVFRSPLQFGIQIVSLCFCLLHQTDNLNTRPVDVSVCPVFKRHSITGPFGIQPLFDHLNTRLVSVFRSPLYSDLGEKKFPVRSCENLIECS